MTGGCYNGRVLLFAKYEVLFTIGGLVLQRVLRTNVLYDTHPHTHTHPPRVASQHINKNNDTDDTHWPCNYRIENDVR